MSLFLDTQPLILIPMALHTITLPQTDISSPHRTTNVSLMLKLPTHDASP